MESTTLLLGHWGKNSRIKKGSPISKATATEDFMRWLIDKSEECPYTKYKADGSVNNDYTNFKGFHLPILWFTASPWRYDSEKDSVNPTGFCCIDIDNIPNKRISTSHPSVFAINYSANGVHIICHSADIWGAKGSSWQNTYDRMAWEMQKNLEPQYGVLKFDPGNSFFHQGCYIWKTEWCFNPDFDPYYTLPQTPPTQEQIDGLYDKERKPVKDKKIRTAKDIIRGSDEDIAENAGISAEMTTDLLSLGFTEFLAKYNDRYAPYSDDEPIFTEQEDIEGNIYSVCETNGMLLKYWYPFYGKKKAGGEKKRNGLVAKGGRGDSVYKRASTTANYNAENLDRNRVLYDAVWWYENFCDHKEGNLSKSEILSTVARAIAHRKKYNFKPMVDKRAFISGNYMIDKTTGEVLPLNKGMKIAGTSRFRRKKRIDDMLWEWDSSQSLDYNIAEVMRRCGIKTKKTVIAYLKSAKANKKYVEKYPFLNNITFKERGRQSKEITVLELSSGNEYSFKSHKECMQWLGIPTKTSFRRFAEGKSRLNKDFKVIKSDT